MSNFKLLLNSAFMLFVSLLVAPLFAKPAQMPRPINKSQKTLGQLFKRKSRDRIKISSKDAKDEIGFWARQMSEHALFLALGLDDLKLKREGIRLHMTFENYRRRFSQTPSTKVMNSILPLLDNLKAYKQRVLDTLNQGRWIGYIYPAFVEHTLLELNYFADKLKGKGFKPDQEIAFWNKERSDEAAVAAKLLDPSEEELAKQSREISLKIKTLPKSEEDMMIKLSLKAYDEFDKFGKKIEIGMKAKKLKSIIHPLLLEHVKREGERAVIMLDRLKKPSKATKKAAK